MNEKDKKRRILIDEVLLNGKLQENPQLMKEISLAL